MGKRHQFIIDGDKWFLLSLNETTHVNERARFFVVVFFRPSIGPSFITHMDQPNNDQSIVTDQFHQQQTAEHDLLSAIVEGTQAASQLDCGINQIDSNIQ